VLVERTVRVVRAMRWRLFIFVDALVVVVVVVVVGVKFDDGRQEGLITFSCGACKELYGDLSIRRRGSRSSVWRQAWESNEKRVGTWEYIFIFRNSSEGPQSSLQASTYASTISGSTCPPTACQYASLNIGTGGTLHSRLRLREWSFTW
jgi:hypothetical protein